LFSKLVEMGSLFSLDQSTVLLDAGKDLLRSVLEHFAQSSDHSCIGSESRVDRKTLTAIEDDGTPALGRIVESSKNGLWNGGLNDADVVFLDQSRPFWIGWKAYQGSERGGP
jgi:hypothetical protein